jgi:putative flippase GtrA
MMERWVFTSKKKISKKEMLQIMVLCGACGVNITPNNWIFMLNKEYDNVYYFSYIIGIAAASNPTFISNEDKRVFTDYDDLITYLKTQINENTTKISEPL